MATQERLYSYGEETSPTHKKNRAMKRNEAQMTLKQVGEIVGMQPASVGGVEKRVIKKLVMGLRSKGISYSESILAIQRLLGVQDPRVILCCLPDDFKEIAGQELKNENRSRRQKHFQN